VTSSTFDKHLTPPKHTSQAAYSLRALGRNNLPEQFVVQGVRYELERTIKHDFWAVTGFYQDANGRRVVLKMGRVNDFAGFPFEWIGKRLCRREVRFYKALQDLPNIPALVGTVGKTGFVHDYIPGAPLDKSRQVPDGFFAELQQLIKTIHGRNMAYVDTNKPQNILQGDDGRPYLIDFQISWDLHEMGNNFITRWWLRRLQQEDIYHILKHKRRFRPDETTPEEFAAAKRQSIWIKIHRIISKPYFLIRRRTFKRLRKSGQLLPEGSK
jgi:hypothetical protein